jgi:hypothetical protein
VSIQFVSIHAYEAFVVFVNGGEVAPMSDMSYEAGRYSCRQQGVDGGEVNTETPQWSSGSFSFRHPLPQVELPLFSIVL